MRHSLQSSGKTLGLRLLYWTLLLLGFVIWLGVLGLMGYAATLLSRAFGDLAELLGMAGGAALWVLLIMAIFQLVPAAFGIWGFVMEIWKRKP